MIAFRTSQNIDFLVTYMAIHLAGSVATPLEKDMPEELFAEISAHLSSVSSQHDDIRDGKIGDVLYTTRRSKPEPYTTRATYSNSKND